MITRELRIGALIVAGAIAAHAAPQTCLAAVVSFNWDIENKTGLDAKDFHVTIVSDKPLTQGVTFNGAFAAPTVTKQAGGLVYDVAWAGGTVAKDGKTHVGLEFTGDAGAKVQVINVRWTGADGFQIGTGAQQPRFPGWKAQPLFRPAFNFQQGANPPVNDPLGVGGLRFGLFDTQVPLPMMMAGLLSGPTENPFSLFPGSSDYDGPWMTLPGGVLPDHGFVVMEAQSSYSTPEFGEITNTFLMQMEIPAPATLVLLAAGPALAVRRRR